MNKLKQIKLKLNPDLKAFYVRWLGNASDVFHIYKPHITGCIRNGCLVINSHANPSVSSVDIYQTIHSKH